MVLHRAGNRNMSLIEKLMVTMCLIHILIARIKSNIHKFGHAKEQEAESAFTLPIELSNVCQESIVDPNITPRCYKQYNLQINIEWPFIRESSATWFPKKKIKNLLKNNGAHTQNDRTRELEIGPLIYLLLLPDGVQLPSRF